MELDFGDHLLSLTEMENHVPISGYTESRFQAFLTDSQIYVWLQRLQAGHFLNSNEHLSKALFNSTALPSVYYQRSKIATFKF